MAFGADPQRVLLKQPHVVNEGSVYPADVLIEKGWISRIGTALRAPSGNYLEINAEGRYLFPGVIDNHVHFREPGLTHKGTIASESRAAVAGGVTATMEMPNTIPQTIDLQALNDKYQRASATAWTNYAFYLGATLDNREAIKQANEVDICGIKVFMGSSTGNMHVDDPVVLNTILSETRHLVAVHAEDEKRIQDRTQTLAEKYPAGFPLEAFPEIRDAKACYNASQSIINLAKQHGARLHILHLTTADETGLFETDKPLTQKRITTEACVHHLWFSADDYASLGNKLKCFPPIKDPQHGEALLAALKRGQVDQIASDHAPHTLLEKQQSAASAPGGIPMVQHNLPAMLALHQKGEFSLPEIAEKTAHNPALTYKVRDRGFLREGFKADCVLVDLNQPLRVKPSNIQSKAGWSPFQGTVFPASVTHTFVNGHLAFYNGHFTDQPPVEPLAFEAHN